MDKVGKALSIINYKKDLLLFLFTSFVAGKHLCKSFTLPQA